MTQEPNLNPNGEEMQNAAHQGIDGYERNLQLAETGQYEEAKSFFQESLSTFKKVGDLWGLNKVRENLGNMAYLSGNYTEAKSLYQECLEALRRLDDRNGIGSCFNNLGVIAYEMGEYELAIQYQLESLQTFREIGYRWNIGLCLNDLGKASFALGRYREADDYFHAAFVSSVEIGSVPICLATLVGLANLSIKEGHLQKALEYVVLVLHHPGSNQEIRDQAQSMVNELEKSIPPDVIKVVQEHVKGRELKKLIDAAEEIMKEGQQRTNRPSQAKDDQGKPLSSNLAS